MKPKKMLDLPVDSDDCEAETIREYLKELLSHLWDKGEGFSGKRPFGNSGWEHTLYEALVRGDAISGELDDDGYVEYFDLDAANEAIFDCIDELS